MKQGDTAHPLVLRAAYSMPTGTPFAVPSDTPCYIRMIRDGTTDPTLDDVDADTVASADGIVTITRAWAQGETDVPGWYSIEATMLLNSGDDQVTLPTHGTARLHIEPVMWTLPEGLS